jgi:hypothetical protein
MLTVVYITLIPKLGTEVPEPHQSSRPGIPKKGTSGRSSDNDQRTSSIVSKTNMANDQQEEEITKDCDIIPDSGAEEPVVLKCLRDHFGLDDAGKMTSVNKEQRVGSSASDCMLYISRLGVACTCSRGLRTTLKLRIDSLI